MFSKNFKIKIDLFLGLKASLLDPVPEVRTVSARALGAMVKGMAENSVAEDLLPWLMQTLTSEASPVDRQVLKLLNYLFTLNFKLI